MTVNSSVHLNPAAPVLALADDALQVGWDQPLVLRQLTASQCRFVQSLEGGRRMSTAERRRHARLLRQLEDAGLLVTSTPPTKPSPVVRLHGAGALGTEAAVALARAGVAVAVVDAAPARGHLAAHLQDPDCGTVALARVKAAVPQAIVRGAHAQAGLDIVISAGPAVSHSHELFSAGLPHLLVECGERGVTVGPVVVPGASACATCLGLYETERRPEWPVLALQGNSRRPRVEAATATLAGALLAHEALAFLAGRATQRWRVEPTGVQPLKPVKVHPDCRCTRTGLLASTVVVPPWPAPPLAT